jgi:hypothetical protein
MPEPESTASIVGSPAAVQAENGGTGRLGRRNSSTLAWSAHGQHIIVVPDSRFVVTVCDESGFDAPTEEFVTTYNDVIFKPILQP